jgi:hypothetical protein
MPGVLPLPLDLSVAIFFQLSALSIQQRAFSAGDFLIAPPGHPSCTGLLKADS